MDDRTGTAHLEGSQAEDAGGPFEDLRAAVDRRDWAAAGAAVRAGWFALAGEDSEVTRRILERVPDAALKAEPLLAMELGIAYNKLRFHRVRALRYFVLAIRAARSKKAADLDPVDRLLIRTAESGAFRLLGRTASSVSAARAAHAIAESLDERDRSAVPDLPRIYAVIGVSLLYGGHSDAALDAAARGLAEAPITPPSNGFGALALLAGIHTTTGNLPDAREHLEYARSGPWTDDQRNGYSGTLYRVAETVVALERFDTATARAQLGWLLATSRGRHANEHWTTLAQLEAMIELIEGNPARGLAELDAFAAMRGAEGRAGRTRLAGIRSLLHLALGNPHAAAGIVRRDAAGDASTRITRARIALSLGQTGTSLQELRAIASQHLSTRETAEAVAVEAAILLRLAASPRRDAVIHRLGALLERSELRIPLVLLPADDVVRLLDALSAAGYAHVVAGVPPKPLFVSIEPTSLLSERELAVLALLIREGTVGDIAHSLAVSSNTVKTQLRSIYRKLGVADRQSAVAMALELNLLIDRD